MCYAKICGHIWACVSVCLHTGVHSKDCMAMFELECQSTHTCCLCAAVFSMVSHPILFWSHDLSFITIKKILFLDGLVLLWLDCKFIKTTVSSFFSMMCYLHVHPPKWLFLSLTDYGLSSKLVWCMRTWSSTPSANPSIPWSRSRFQDDVLPGTLTVYEYLLFHASLKLAPPKNRSISDEPPHSDQVSGRPVCFLFVQLG